MHVTPASPICLLIEIKKSLNNFIQIWRTSIFPLVENYFQYWKSVFIKNSMFWESLEFSIWWNIQSMNENEFLTALWIAFIRNALCSRYCFQSIRNNGTKNLAFRTKLKKSSKLQIKNANAINLKLIFNNNDRDKTQWLCCLDRISTVRYATEFHIVPFAFSIVVKWTTLSVVVLLHTRNRLWPTALEIAFAAPKMCEMCA